MSPASVRTPPVRSGDERTKHEATAPPSMIIKLNFIRIDRTPCIELATALTKTRIWTPIQPLHLLIPVSTHFHIPLKHKFWVVFLFFAYLSLMYSFCCMISSVLSKMKWLLLLLLLKSSLTCPLKFWKMFVKHWNDIQISIGLKKELNLFGTLYKLLKTSVYVRFDYQPLFGKAARAPPPK